ncbi:uncharacterized protein B0I36DRAFT_360735 [Microdochium trichocladiopsis]|uniref:Exoribonuclease phosphorolytic domain-containing protein n=1 Tax=Microdochium trichocladiopsis TaxID=1682393 RepID=A0A9P8YCD1_9PEZI|nr:uncharacterized protein B0I36DRAFT_360735 [Microdochium trichocladiopsis]KAH7035350.1 hypothetical protein B0I36DRAFT_360735 [Microdochium trichocladiopsis]
MSHSDPEARLSHLPKADGSATFSYAGYTIVGAVNGPIEVQRRDELPEEAAIDVVVRPAAGVGTRERHLESILEATLRQIILVNSFPRTLIQVILQITVAPENEYVNAKVSQASLNLPMLPALLQTAVLSLLSAGVPLTATVTPVSFSIKHSGSEIVVNPSPRQVETAKSFHVFAFTSHDELILAESEGSFTTRQWDDLYNQARAYCCPSGPSGTDIDMDDERSPDVDLKSFVRSTMQEKITEDLHWKTLG